MSQSCNPCSSDPLWKSSADQPMPPLGIIAWLRADWGDLGRERMKEGKLIKYTMGREREVDEEHMLIQRDNPEERRRAASQIFTGTVDGAQLGWQMAQIAWKCLGGVRRVWSAKTRLIITSLCITWHISSPSPLSPIHLASHRKTVHCSQHGLSASKVSSSEPRPATDTSADLYFDKCNKESPIGNSNLTPWEFVVPFWIQRVRKFAPRASSQVTISF